MAERYEHIKDIVNAGYENASLVKDKKSNELFAIKYMKRGYQIDEKVQKEIFNHRSLRHPNIVMFKEVFVTPTHLAIVTEYASGGELFNRVANAGRFTEDEARFFFQQLISGVSYCHSMEICHKDLKLENILLDGSPTPRLKICDIRYSMSRLLHARPKRSLMGIPDYMAPEVLSQMEYDGKIADVWSCGVTLYVMLVGAYPFEAPDDPKNIRKSIQRLISVQYSIPDYVTVSADCQHLLSRIFVANPSERITIPEIKKHPWFLTEGQGTNREKSECELSVQSEEEIMRIISEARKKSEEETIDEQLAGLGLMDADEDDFELLDSD